MKNKDRSTQPLARGGRVGPFALVFLLALLVLPALVLRRVNLWIDWRFIASVWAVLCLATYCLYRSDKQRAESGQWRIPESTLHIAELLGGWPGAYFAQRQYRHKTVKLSYQAFFWMIVLLYQFVAGDFLADWKISRSVVLFIKSKVV